ncbi:hypothetical protein NQ318_022183 [Aromia moschata]|uniref:Uncharacterized protein n=1 Tax=Aromia moschata TaxID=1265417 RepID=A0AAV8Z5Z6_9CUCU|nr:hypothetical protein NQ318_022183 [Aromia moschata]
MSTISTTAHLNAGTFVLTRKRPRLVLKAKRIPHEIVNIDLSDRPDWYYKIHPEALGSLGFGKMQSSSTVGSVKVYHREPGYMRIHRGEVPQNPLYPSEPEAKRRDKELIDMIDPVIEYSRSNWLEEGQSFWREYTWNGRLYVVAMGGTSWGYHHETWEEPTGHGGPHNLSSQMEEKICANSRFATKFLLRPKCSGRSFKTRLKV